MREAHGASLGGARLISYLDATWTLGVSNEILVGSL